LRRGGREGENRAAAAAATASAIVVGALDRLDDFVAFLIPLPVRRLFSDFDLAQWPAIAGYAAMWAVAGLLVRRILRSWLARIASHQKTELTDVLAATIPRPAGIAVFLVGLASGLRLLAVPETRMLEMHRALAFLLATLGVGLMMRVALRAIDAYGRSNPGLQSSAGIGRAVTWAAGLAIEAVLASDTLGVSLVPSLTALGVGSLSVALALQDTLSNFFSGVQVILDRPVRPGDFVRVEPSFEGYVTSIGWRSTHLRTLGNNLVVIPNAVLAKAVITNYTLPTPNVSSSVRVDVMVGADVAKVEAILAEVAKGASGLQGVAAESAPQVSLSPGFVDGGIAFTIFFNVKSFGEQAGIQHALRMRIAAALRKEGIALRGLGP
jgi:small-conductance mechanosensitive channel